MNFMKNLFVSNRKIISIYIIWMFVNIVIYFLRNKEHYDQNRFFPDTHSFEINLLNQYDFPELLV